MAGLKIELDIDAAKRASAQLRQELKTLGSSAVDNEQEFKKLEDRLKDGMKADQAKKSIDNLEDSLKLTRLETARLQRQTGDMAGAFSTLTGGVSPAKAAVGALTVAFTGLAVATVLATKAGMEFEQSMKTVEAVSRATAEEFAELESKAREMGASTEWSATQASEALKFLSMAGMKASESISALPGMLDLATAAQMDLAEASDIATDTLTAFGMETSEITKLSDALVNTSIRANTTVSMLGESFKYVAPVAANMGYSIEQASGMLGILANSGIKADMAGTSLRQTMLRTGKAARSLGLDVKSDLIDVLEEMKSRQYSVNDVVKQFGVIASTGVTILMNNVDAYKELTEEIENNEGATKRLAAEMRDTLKNDVKLLGSSVEDTKLKMYDAFGDDMRELIQSITATIGETEDAFVWLGEKISTVISHTSKFLNSLRDVNTGLEAVKAGHMTLGELLGDESVLAAGAARYREYLKDREDATKTYSGQLKNDIEDIKKQIFSKESTDNFFYYDKDYQKHLNEISELKLSLQGLLDIQEAMGGAVDASSIDVVVKAEKDVYDARAIFIKEFEQSQLESILKSTKYKIQAAEEDLATYIEYGGKEVAYIAEKERKIQALKDVFASKSIKNIKKDNAEKIKLQKEYDKFSAGLYEKLKSEDEKRVAEDFNQFKKDLKERTDAEQKYLDEQEDARQKHQDAQEEAYADFSDTIQETTADILGDWDNAWDSMIDIMKNALVQMAAEALTSNIIVPVAMDIGSAFGLSWGGISMSSMAGSSGGLFGNLQSLWGGAKSGYSALTTEGGISNAIYNSAPWLGSTMPGTTSASMMSAGASQGLTYPGAASGSVPGGFGGTTYGTALYGSGSSSILAGAGAAAILMAVEMDLFGGSSGKPKIVGDNTTYTAYNILMGEEGRSGPTTWMKSDDPDAIYKTPTLADFDIPLGINEGSDEEFAEWMRGVLNQYLLDFDDAVSEVSINDIINQSDIDFSKSIEGSSDEMTRAILDSVFTDIRSGLVSEVFNIDSELLPKDFFQTIAPSLIDDEGNEILGTLFDGFNRFYEVINQNDSALESFTNQVSNIGLAAEDAFANIETVYSILDAAQSVVDSISSSSTITTLENVVITYDSYIDAMENAYSTQSELADLQVAMAQEIGSATTGLTADSIQSGIMSAATSGTSISDAITATINASLSNTIAGVASEDIMSGYVAELNRQVGEAVVNATVDGVLDSGILADAYTEIINEFDFVGMESSVSDAVESISELIDVENAVTDATDNMSDGLNSIWEAAGKMTSLDIFAADFQAKYGVTPGIKHSAEAVEFLSTADETTIQSLADGFGVTVSEMLQDIATEAEAVADHIDLVSDLSSEIEQIGMTDVESEIYSIKQKYQDDIDQISVLEQSIDATDGVSDSVMSMSDILSDKLSSITTILISIADGTQISDAVNDIISTDSGTTYSSDFINQFEGVSDSWVTYNAAYLQDAYNSNYLPFLEGQSQLQENYNDFSDYFNSTYGTPISADHSGKATEFVSTATDETLQALADEFSEIAGWTVSVDQMLADIATESQYVSGSYYGDYTPTSSEQELLDRYNLSGMSDIAGFLEDVANAAQASESESTTISTGDLTATGLAELLQADSFADSLEGWVEDIQTDFDQLNFTDLEKSVAAIDENTAALIYDAGTYLENFIISAEEYENIVAMINKVADSQKIENATENINTMLEGIESWNNAMDDTYSAIGEMVLLLNSLGKDSLPIVSAGIDVLNATIASEEDGLNDFSASLVAYGGIFESLNASFVAGTITAGQYNSMLSTATSLYTESIDQIKNQKSNWESFSDSVSGWLDNLSADNLNPEETYEAASRYFNETYAAAIAGDTDAQDSLAGAASDFLTASSEYQVNQQDYMADYVTTKSYMADAVDLADEQVDAIDEMLDVAEEQVISIEDLTDVTASSLADLYSVNSTIVDVLELLPDTSDMGDLLSQYLGGDSELADLLRGLGSITDESYYVQDPGTYIDTPGSPGTISGDDVIYPTGGLEEPSSSLSALGAFRAEYDYLTFNNGATVTAADGSVAYDLGNGQTVSSAYVMANPELVADTLGLDYGYAGGGISTGSSSGHIELLHDTEAVIPLERGSLNLNIPSIKDLLREVKELRKEIIAIQKDNAKSNYDTAYYTERTYMEAQAS